MSSTCAHRDRYNGHMWTHTYTMPHTHMQTPTQLLKYAEYYEGIIFQL